MQKEDIVGMFTGRMFLSLMARTTMNQTSRVQKTRKLRRDRGFQKYRQGPRDGLIGEAKVETREHLENLVIQRDQNLRRKSDSGHWITNPEGQQ
jgi:hypothetical protein